MEGAGISLVWKQNLGIGNTCFHCRDRFAVKVVPSIFTQFWSRSHFDKLDWMTSQDIYYILVYIQLLPAKTPRETSFVPLLLLRKPHHYNTRHDCTKNLHHHLTKTNTVLLRLKLNLFFSKIIRFILLNMKPLYIECIINCVQLPLFD